ncbi:transcriptional regulator [Streptomyces griseus]|nr:transcriptional regulator [Streptomyces griseus]
MLRVHFTTEDIARVRVATGPDPLWEIVNSFHILLTGAKPLVFGDWRRRVLRRPPPAIRPLGPLLPPRGFFPDFLTPDLRGDLDLPHAVDTVLGTTRTVLRGDLRRLAAARPRSRPLPAETRALADGRPQDLRRLGEALLGYHRQALAPFGPRIREQLDADLTVRARAVLSGGTEALLQSLRPVLRWRPPVLEADYPVDQDLRLDGRGLLLQPSFFCVRTPITLACEELTPVIVYPVEHSLGWAADRDTSCGADGTEGPDGRGGGLGALMGCTRAAVLEDVVNGRTTGDLARRLGISPAAVSQHTAVLRGSGLLLSVRRGRHVLHTVTPKGLALLDHPHGTPVAG